MRDRAAELLRVASRLPAAARSSFLELAEPGDEALRRDVLSLVAHDTDRGELAVAELRGPRQVGPWRLTQPLGEAAPARLFRGRHAEDPDRCAVLAVLESPSAGPAVAAALKRQAHAQHGLAHPGLARLLDADGADPELLYMVFEDVEGIALAEYSDALRLPLRERVRLLEQVARVVACAHAAGLVPLGLLPWSVLVTWAAGEPRAAVIACDPWPLLAVLDPDARPRHDLLAALETSAPEALRGEARGERSDVFALGALGFELLTGTPPLGLGELAGRRSLREELRRAAALRAPLASQRVAGLGRQAEAAASARSSTCAELVDRSEEQHV